MSDEIEFHREQEHCEWTAVYLNGQLQCVGDNYLADEWLYGYVGVAIVDDSAFMRGGNGRDTVAATLEEVEAYRFDRDMLLSRAAALREQAAELEAEAERTATRATETRVP